MLRVPGPPLFVVSYQALKFATGFRRFLRNLFVYEVITGSVQRRLQEEGLPLWFATLPSSAENIQSNPLIL